MKNVDFQTPRFCVWALSGLSPTQHNDEEKTFLPMRVFESTLIVQHFALNGGLPTRQHCVGWMGNEFHTHLTIHVFYAYTGITVLL